VSLHPRNLAAALLPALLATTVLAACSGGGSGPTAPPDPQAAGQVVSTSSGSLTVVSYGCGEDLDLHRMAGEVGTTARIAARQNPSTFDGAVLLDGFEIHARTPSDSSNRCDGNAACFERVGNRGRLHVWCDGGGLEHETAHALGWGGHLSCWETIYHSNNFRCERTTNLYGA
jgi:hypothetical protein